MAQARIGDIVEKRNIRWRRVAEQQTETAGGVIDFRAWYVGHERQHKIDRFVVRAAEYACVVLLTLLIRELIVRILL